MPRLENGGDEVDEIVYIRALWDYISSAPFSGLQRLSFSCLTYPPTPGICRLGRGSIVRYPPTAAQGG